MLACAAWRKKLRDPHEPEPNILHALSITSHLTETCHWVDEGDILKPHGGTPNR